MSKLSWSSPLWGAVGLVAVTVAVLTSLKWADGQGRADELERVARICTAPGGELHIGGQLFRCSPWDAPR